MALARPFCCAGGPLFDPGERERFDREEGDRRRRDTTGLGLRSLPRRGGLLEMLLSRLRGGGETERESALLAGGERLIERALRLGGEREGERLREYDFWRRRGALEPPELLEDDESESLELESDELLLSEEDEGALAKA